MRLRQMATAALMTLATTTGQAVTGEAATAVPAGAELCAAPDDLPEERSTLPMAAKALAARGGLRVLAVGSLSTAGAGTSPATAWPARLEAALRARFPAADIQVVNRGRPKTDAAAMLAQLPADVAETRPDVVVWESGAVDAVRGSSVDAYRRALAEGTAALAARGVDVILMDAQFSRAYSALVDFQPYIEAADQVGEMRDLVVFHRYALMRHWVESGRLSAEDVGKPLQLQTADRIYDCVGRLLARAVADAVQRAPH